MSTIAETARRLAADPYAATSRSAATATVTGGPATVSTGQFGWESDLPSAIGGQGVAPSPVSFFLGSIAGCSAAMIKHTLAPEFDVEIDGVSVTVRCTTDHAPMLGLGAGPGLSDFTIDIAIESRSPAHRVAALQRAWLARCPLYLALRDPTDIGITFTSSARQTIGRTPHDHPDH